MKKTMMIAALTALPVGLSGCDKKPEAPKVEAPKAAATADAMPNMEMPVGSKMGKGSGTVTAIDAVAGKGIQIGRGVLEVGGERHRVLNLGAVRIRVGTGDACIGDGRVDDIAGLRMCIELGPRQLLRGRGSPP